MKVLTNASIFASEGAEGGNLVPAWVYGVSTFAIFVVLLVITMMIKVGRD